MGRFPGNTEALRIVGQVEFSVLLLPKKTARTIVGQGAASVAAAPPQRTATNTLAMGVLAMVLGFVSMGG